MQTPVHISSLYIYPVKSCRGVAVQEAEVTPRGFALDRRWMLVDEHGEFLSQRNTPLLCRIQPAMNHRGLSLHYLHESIPPLFIPSTSYHGTQKAVNIWGDQVLAYSVGNHADEWFSRILGKTCHLVWMGPDSIRPVDPGYSQPGDTVSFADGFPYLFLGRSSMDELNRRLRADGKTILPIERFRPNIVVTGAEAHAEDRWTTFKTGDLTFDLVKACERCVVTTLDTHSGVYGQEPLRTLATYRRGETGVLFGINALVKGSGVVRVGDRGVGE